MDAATSFNDLEAAERAYERVKAEIDAVDEGSLAPMNVDVVSATSVVLGVADRILAFREQMAGLTGFDLRNVDSLVDYATAAWYVYVTNLPSPKPEVFDAMLREMTELRAKLLMWAGPLVGSGKFDEAAIAKIKEGAGHKDIPGDVVALVGLYRSKWEDVKQMCGVTEQDLERGALVGPAVFAMVSQRENRVQSSASQDSLHVRRAWTLVDRAYTQCRRAIGYLRFEEGDADLIAPSLRRNPGPRSSTPVAPEVPAMPATPPAIPPAMLPAEPPPTPLAGPPVGGSPIGSGSSPFAAGKT